MFSFTVPDIINGNSLAYDTMPETLNFPSDKYISFCIVRRNELWPEPKDPITIYSICFFKLNETFFRIMSISILFSFNFDFVSRIIDLFAILVEKQHLN